jgi:hypothetical protein
MVFWFWIPGLRQEAHPGMTTMDSAGFFALIEPDAGVLDLR